MNKTCKLFNFCFGLKKESVPLLFNIINRLISIKCNIFEEQEQKQQEQEQH